MIENKGLFFLIRRKWNPQSYHQNTFYFNFFNTLVFVSVWWYKFDTSIVFGNSLKRISSLLNCKATGFSTAIIARQNFPGGAHGKEPCLPMQETQDASYTGVARCKSCRRHKTQDARLKRCKLNPWVGKVPGRRTWQPTQYSCLENSMDRGAWWATVHRITQTWTWQKRFSMHAQASNSIRYYCSDCWAVSFHAPKILRTQTQIWKMYK